MNEYNISINKYSNTENLFFNQRNYKSDERSKIVDTMHNFFIEVFLRLQDPISEQNFCLTCKDFYKIAASGVKILKIYNYILKNFKIIKESTSFSELSPLAIKKCDVFFIAEIHISSNHRQLNSQLVNLIWDEETTILTEADDSSQIPKALECVKDSIKCWDTNKDFLNSVWYLYDATCEACKGFVVAESLAEGDKIFNFELFLNYYIQTKKILLKLCPELKQFHSFETIKTICENGKKESDFNTRKNLIKSLLNHLILEVKEVTNYSFELMNSADVERNNSLICSVERELGENKTPILLAGFLHITSNNVIEFRKKKSINSISLMPNNTVPSSSENLKKNIEKEQLPKFKIYKEDRLSEIANCIDEESSYWSELTTILMGIKNCNGDLEKIYNFIHSNQISFKKLEIMILNYSFKPEWIYIWAEIPRLIFLNKLNCLNS